MAQVVAAARSAAAVRSTAVVPVPSAAGAAVGSLAVARNAAAGAVAVDLAAAFRRDTPLAEPTRAPRQWGLTAAAADPDPARGDQAPAQDARALEQAAQVDRALALAARANPTAAPQLDPALVQ